MLTQLMLLIQVECSASSSYSWPHFEMENSAVTEWHLVCTEQYKVVAVEKFYTHHHFISLKGGLEQQPVLHWFDDWQRCHWRLG